MKGTAIQLTDGTSGSIDLKFDVKRDSSGKIISGLVIGDTLNQNQGLLLVMQPGELKEFPTLGVGIQDFLLSEDFRALPSAVIESFTADGMKVQNVSISKTKQITINATY
jgi:hypothetical protein